MADDPSGKDDAGSDDTHHPEAPRQVRDPRSYSATGAYGGDEDKPADDDDDDVDKGGADKDGNGEKKKGLLQRPAVLIGGVVVLLVVILLAVLFWLNARKFQSTDDAYIDTRIVHVAPQIAGRVSRVDVDDNALVGVGQPLLEIDPIDVNQKVAQSQAQRAQAVAQEAQAQAQKVAAQAQIRTSQKSYEQSAAQIPGAVAQARSAANDLARYTGLARVNPLAVAQQQLDTSRAQAAQTASQAAADKKAAEAAQAQVDQARTQIAASDAQIAAARAQIANADAQLASAGTNAGYSRLTSPVLGHVSRLTVAVGNYVQAGQELMAITPANLWVTANFKETQLKLMKPGDPVDLKVDAYPQAAFHGHVDSIQRGAGQAFAILPSENATGNFVKVVQRVPVKIVIDNLDDARHPLGPGMSVEPKVRVR